jgi:hypothetical protein
MIRFGHVLVNVIVGEARQALIPPAVEDLGLLCR